MAKGDKLYYKALRLAEQEDYDYHDVLHLLNESIRLGNKKASYALATWYLNGIHVRKNYKKGFSLLQKAIQGGTENNFTLYKDALSDIAVCYELGNGVQKDKQKAYYYYFILQSVNKNGERQFTDIQGIVNMIKRFFCLNEDASSSLEQVVNNQTINAVNGSFVVDFLNSFDNQHPELGIYRDEKEKEIFQIKKSALTLLEKMKVENLSDDLISQFFMSKERHPSICVANAILENVVSVVSSKTLSLLKKFASIDKNLDAQIALLTCNENDKQQYVSLIKNNPIFYLRGEELKPLTLKENNYDAEYTKSNS